MQDFVNFLDDDSTSFSYPFQSPQQIGGSSSSPNTLLFGYKSPVYKGLGLGLSPMMRTFPSLRNSSPMTSPIADVAARKGKGKRPAAEEWLEGLQLPKRHQVVDLRESEPSPNPSVEMNQYVPEQAETRTTFSEEADDHRPAENIQEVTEEPLQLDLVTNIDSLVETLCTMWSQVDELQNERGEYFKALQTVQEELSTYKETIGKVMVALGYGE